MHIKMDSKQLPFIQFFFLVLGLLIALWQNEKPVSDPVLTGNSFPAIENPLMIGTAPPAGSLVMYNFFASWCSPCIAELPYLELINHKGNIEVVGLSWDKNRESLEKWLEKHGNPYSAIYDDNDGKLGFDLGIKGLPETLLVDKNGIIRFHHRGPITRVQMEEVLTLINRIER